MLVSFAACVSMDAAKNSTSVSGVSQSDGRLSIGVKRKRISSSGRRKNSANPNRRVRSRLAKSCSGHVGSDLLEEWFKHCHLVFTGVVEKIDREQGTIGVTMRRVIRSLVNETEWTVVSSWANYQRKTQQPAGPSNALDPLPLLPETASSGPLKPALILHDLFDARQNSCVPQFRIRVHDVLLFFVQIHPPNQTLHLVSAPLRITLRNLRLIHTSPESPTGKLLSLGRPSFYEQTECGDGLRRD